jgi:hypothetical protein
VSRCPECGAEFIDDDGESWPYCPICLYEPNAEELGHTRYPAARALLADLDRERTERPPTGYEFHRYLRDKQQGRR